MTESVGYWLSSVFPAQLQLSYIARVGMSFTKQRVKTCSAESVVRLGPRTPLSIVRFVLDPGPSLGGVGARDSLRMFMPA